MHRTLGCIWELTKLLPLPGLWLIRECKGLSLTPYHTVYTAMRTLQHSSSTGPISSCACMFPYVCMASQLISGAQKSQHITLVMERALPFTVFLSM